MRTIIYGVIEEYGLNTDRLAEVYAHNEQVLANLPDSDSWPPLSTSMFSITKNVGNTPGPNLEYWGRIIHFAACLNSVEYEWPEWKAKFEELLLRLYWVQANVHFNTEYTGIMSFKWRVDLGKWNIQEGAITPMKRECWDYEDLSGWERHT